MSTKRETIQKIVENAKRARSSGKKYTAEITISLDAQAVRMLMVQTGAQTKDEVQTLLSVAMRRALSGGLENHGKIHVEVMEEVEGKESSRQVVDNLKAENAALRAAAEYLIAAGGADCCARCIFDEEGEEENGYDCGHGGECLEGMIRFEKRGRGGGNG